MRKHKIKSPLFYERGFQLGVILFQPSGKQAIQENGPGWRARMTIFFTLFVKFNQRTVPFFDVLLNSSQRKYPK